MIPFNSKMLLGLANSMVPFNLRLSYHSCKGRVCFLSTAKYKPHKEFREGHKQALKLGVHPLICFCDSFEREVSYLKLIYLNTCLDKQLIANA